MFAYYLRLALRELQAQSRPHRAHGVRHRARHLGVHDHAHELPRRGRQSGRRAQRHPVRAVDRQLGSRGRLRLATDRRGDRQARRADDAHLSRCPGAVRVHDPRPQGHHVQGRRHLQPPRQGHGAGVHRDAHDHGGLLRDVRDAVSVRRPLGRQGGCRPRTRGGAQQGNQPEGVRRREQRRQDGALARSRIPRGRRARTIWSRIPSIST